MLREYRRPAVAIALLQPYIKLRIFLPACRLIHVGNIKLKYIYCKSEMNLCENANDSDAYVCIKAGSQRNYLIKYLSKENRARDTGGHPN